MVGSGQGDEGVREVGMSATIERPAFAAMWSRAVGGMVEYAMIASEL